MDKGKFLQGNGTKVSMAVMSTLSDAQELNGTEGATLRINFAKWMVNMFEDDMTVRVDTAKLSQYFMKKVYPNK